MPSQVQISFNAELLRRIDTLARNGHRQEILIVLAEALQHELTVNPCYRDGQRVPYHGGLDLTVRAIIAVLDTERRDGGGMQGEYVSNNLRIGVRCLAEELEQDVPSFAKREAERAIRLSQLD